MSFDYVVYILLFLSFSSLVYTPSSCHAQLSKLVFLVCACHLFGMCVSPAPRPSYRVVDETLQQFRVKCKQLSCALSYSPCVRVHPIAVPLKYPLKQPLIIKEKPYQRLVDTDQSVPASVSHVRVQPIHNRTSTWSSSCGTATE
jgi:hypothetical protein